jgi:PTH1 family peptidyl-tRNA hydrolase
LTPPALIVGLGNPGDEYRNTRHNAGAMVVDRFADHRCSGWRKERKFFAELATGDCGGRKVLCIKPQTYMNLSGEAVVAVTRYHRIPPEWVMVVADDADLPLGAVRMRPSGGFGGHHGIQSVIQHLGTQEFPRQRIGVARPVQTVRDIASHVLGTFSADEATLLGEVLTRAEQQIQCWLEEGLPKAMNLFNRSR